MSEQRPGSVVAAIWLLGAVIVVYGLASVLTAVFDDELVDAWSAGRPDSDSVEPPSFVAVAVVMFIVVASLLVVLMRFFHVGLPWARVLLTGLVAILAIGTLALLVTGPPALFVVALAIGLVLDLASLAMLWRRDTTAFLAGTS
ncbi:hypothetical protein [Nocardioides mangrovi]|uniref:Uncharacterized protein n=1 Tax=Nocardioides mangrovi TaxID=2874580 RepID=A0ABS7U7V9_9ACTN|nr:hypothetical protein [Nocardioides mangrovi]MBZ5736798.1 hypothetical protein [Nocardioides mangrovi]